MAEYVSILQGAKEDAVEVNQRALIDKVLARYSGESVLYRELLQNADDASATTVEIKFQSSASSSTDTPAPPSSTTLPDLTKHLIHRIVARNDGIPFRDQDWARLRKIAEGNPDENKIGAFGVGFYSLWSICDAPVVVSGDTIMGFNWSERNPDQLVTRRGANPTAQSDVTEAGKPWTSFIMDIREPEPMPLPPDFARFLATSLAFTTSIRTIRLFFDDHQLCQLDKKLSPAKPLRLGPHIGTSSPKSMMRIRSADQVGLQIDVKVLKWTLRTGNKKSTKSKLALGAAAAAVKATSASSFAAKMLSAFSTSTRSVSPAQTSTPAEPADDGISATEDLLTPTTASLFLRVVTGNVDVSLSRSFSTELERATKKSPPRKTQYSLIWTSKDEWDASRGVRPQSSTTGKGTSTVEVLSGDDDARSVFDGLLSDLNAQGRVFIGFATHQTTGSAASIAARFIPTVERESLDLQNSHVADWNRELLAIGGVLARVVYEAELNEVAQLWKEMAQPTNVGGGGGNSASDDPVKAWLIGRCLHAMLFFSYHASTPSPVVSSETGRAFFSCAPNSSFVIVSTEGPQLAHKVRLPNPELAAFIKQIPLVPLEAARESAVFLEKLKERRMIRDISFDDVFGELNARALSVDEMRACFTWFIGLTRLQGYDPSLVAKLKSSAMIECPVNTAGGQTDDRIVPLSEARTFVNPKSIPTELPLPLSTLPFDLTKSLRQDDLVRVFGFAELSIVDWLRRLLSADLVGVSAPVGTNIIVSPTFSETVLNVVARAWPSISPAQQAEIAAVLGPQPCVPTRHGMKTPTEAYHSNVNLFQDLAVVTMPSGKPVKGGIERLLTAIGVRKHVELQMVFSRLLGSGDWSHVELTRYLVSVRETLSDVELDRLRNTKWLPRAGEPRVPQPPGADGQSRRDRTVRHLARDLFEPTETLTGLGLPLLDWPVKWRASSDEAQLLAKFGLKSSPSVTEILTIAADPKDATLRTKALGYFIEHFTSYATTYKADATVPAFVPCDMPDGKQGLARPSECYASPDAAVLGVPIVQNAYRPEAGRFQIRQHPKPADLVHRLLEQSKQPASARKAFAYLSSRVNDFTRSDLSRLRDTPILPLEKDGKIIMTKPDVCYFEPGEGSAVTVQLRSLFTYVDFGPAAVPFLMAIGVKREPTVLEITKMLVADPARLYKQTGSAEAYIALLRNIAANSELLTSSLRTEMKRSAFLLGSRRIASASNGTAALHEDDSDDEDGDDLETGETFVYRLARPNELVIVDSAAAYRPFSTVAWACIQEAVIEDLAASLATPRVSDLVRDSYTFTGVVGSSGTPRAQDIRRLVVERSALFLHERQQTSRKEINRDADWLKSHFTVHEVPGLTLRRELPYGGTTHAYSRNASASVAAPSSNEMRLYISSATELDWFEVATGLCKFLLKRERSNDALMFNTILTTTLKNLKRRGMNVDRIINERKAERAAAEHRTRELKLQEELAAAEMDQRERWQLQLEDAFPDADPTHIRNLLASTAMQAGDTLQSATESLLKGYPKRKKAIEAPSNPTADSLSSELTRRGADGLGGESSGGLFQSFKRRLQNSSASGASGGEGAKPPMSDSMANSVMIPQRPRPPVRAPNPGSSATPMSDIRSNLLKAVAASRPDSDLDLHSKKDTTPVKESESSYCDPTGVDADLTFVTSIGGLRFYVSNQVPEGPAAADTHADAIRRYAQQIIRPVGEVFNVDTRCLHVFFDLTGPLIAFNRNGSIFFNLRFYLAWYDERVKQGDAADALIGTFSSFAHELAHNIVIAHNSEHEWWMSAFVEQYFLRLAALIGQQQQQQQQRRPPAQAAAITSA